MPNPYFQFKQFTIYQDRSTLKVSTDSCIFGAWASKQLAVGNQQSSVSSCLDIGAGTGLLMLMAAQQFPGIVHGIEIDRTSYEQAVENIQASPWAHRLQVFNDDVKLFSLPHRYDFIISNPPFFEGDLKAGTPGKNMAKHDEGLTFSDLIEVVDNNLAPAGRFAVLLPYHRTEHIQQLAAACGLYIARQVLLRQTPGHAFFRTMLLFDRERGGAIHTEELIIHTANNQYSPAVTALLKDYYLYL